MKLNTEKTKLPFAKHMWIAIVFFAVITVVSCWFSRFSITILDFNLNAGLVLFPTTLFLSSIITEVYGFKLARCAIWCGFIFNILFIAYGLLVANLPSPQYSTINNQFNFLLQKNLQTTIVTGIIYATCQFLNSYLMSKSKIITCGNFSAIRFLLICTVITIVNYLIISVSYFNIITNQFNFIVMLFSNIICTAFCLPLFKYITNKLKWLEHLDIFDKATKFNPFSFESSYTHDDNYFSVNNDFELIPI